MFTNLLSSLCSFFQFFPQLWIQGVLQLLVNCVILKCFKTYIVICFLYGHKLLIVFFLNFNDFRPLRVDCLFSLNLYGSYSINIPQNEETWKNWKRFRWFLTYKIDFESQILALFDTSPLTQFSKFNNFLWVCWLLGKNLSNFVSPAWNLNNPY